MNNLQDESYYHLEQKKGYTLIRNCNKRKREREREIEKERERKERAGTNATILDHGSQLYSASRFHQIKN